MNRKLLNLLNTAFYCCLMLFSVNSMAQLDVACPFDIKAYAPANGKDCVYFMVLNDAASDGWDGASVDVSIGENAPTNYKVTAGDCLVVPIYVNDGETIDLAYWNGANELDHGLALFDVNGNVAEDANGNPVNFIGNIPANQQLRVKANCPLPACTGDTEDFIVNIKLGNNPAEQSWEIYEGTADAQGPQVTGVNANAYDGAAPGTVIAYPVSLDKCKEYTFVAFDGANDGWATGEWGIMTTDATYGTPVSGTSLYRFLGGTGLVDETRTTFTVPCAPVCEDVNVVSADGDCVSLTAIDLPIAAPQVCYPACAHAACGDITVEHFVILGGGAGASAPGGAGAGAAIGGAGAAVGGTNAAVAGGGVVGAGVLVAGPLTGSGAVAMPFPTMNPYAGIFDVNGDGIISPDADGDGISDVDTNGDGVIDALDAIDAAGFIPVGAHQYITEYTYCDDVVVRCTAALNIVSDANPSLTCNDNVIISLGVPSSSALNECTIIVTPDMVLEDTNACEDEYIVTVIDADGNSLGNLVGPDQLMQTLTYRVEHAFSGNYCWGTLTVEDKLAPVLVAFDYDVPCTHPYALDVDYTHTDTYGGEELPANIAGGAAGLGTTSNVYIPVNIGCGPEGEVIQAISVALDVTHTDVSDLQAVLHIPTALGGGSIILGAVAGTNVYVPTPQSVPALAVLIGAACSDTESTSPEYFATENSGAQLPANIGGTWYIQVIDDSATVAGADTSVGGGEVTAASITLTCGFPEPYAAYDCSLEGVTMISEMVLESHCDQSQWYGSKIERVWQATDKYGRTTTALQTVNLAAPTLDAIRIPGDVNIECTEAVAADLTPTETGIPFYGCFDLTDDLHGLCDISYTYSDETLPTCGLGYKIIRTWTVINWCSGVNKEYEQIIKIEDTVGPTIGQEDVTIGATSYECSADVSFADLGLTDACSGISSATASYVAGGGLYLGSGNLVIVDVLNGGVVSDLPVGTTQLLITAKDNCLNATEKFINVTVVDDVVPVAICDDELHVSLGADGTALVAVEDIDEGSYDNCGDITLEARRLDGCLGETEWAASVPFECCDRDETVTIELRVTDAAGNSNVCWKEILIEDALAPVITCAPDKTLDCNSPEVHAPFAEPTFLDNCSAEIISTVDGGELDQCKAGTLTRRWTVSDGSDKSQDVSCTQRVTVEHVSDFIVQFPADVTLTDCAIQATGEPTVTNDDCELIAINHEDLVLDIVQDACYKIERTWTIINWCVYDQGNAANTDLGFPQPLPRTYQDDDGYFTYVQTIKVLDAVAPVFTSCPDNLTFCDLTDGCEGYAELTTAATDACSDDASIEYQYKIDAFNDGTFDIVANGNDASGVYPYGTHLIKWLIEDGCGNTSACSYTFTIEDCKNPTPVCLHGLAIEIEAQGCTEVWASDLLEYAFDNCTDVTYVEESAKIRREGSNDPLGNGVVLCCEDLGSVGIEVWVEDEAGNADYCTTYIYLQDNQGVCPGENKVAVAGTIFTEAGEMIENVMVEVASEGNLYEEVMTSENGGFGFNAAMDADYNVTPNHDVDPLNGVSTFDLVLMSQHILGHSEFTSPYQHLAADVNNDGNITTFDIVQTRQLILYVIQDFPTNTSWRFVDAAYVFPVATNPWLEAFPEAIDYINLDATQLGTDFVGVKIGDVNGDATPNSLVAAEERNITGTLVLAIDDAELKAGNTTSIDFRASDFDAINGFQFTMNFDAATMNFAGVEAGALTVSEANFGLSMLNEGVITTSWNGETTKVANDEVLFTLNFDITTDVVLSEAVSINSRYTTAEAYAGTDLMDVAVAFNTTNGTLVADSSFELFQNTPNPFTGETLIGFNLPTASNATLKVYDVAGKVLKVVEGDFAKGYNQISLSSNDLDATGVLYYQLDTPANSATLKMIIIK